MWWLRRAAHICNLLPAYHLIYIDADKRIPDDSLFDNPLYPSGEGVAKFSQFLARVLSSDPAFLSEHSAAISAQRSFHP
jgi:hypothetical protein